MSRVIREDQVHRLLEDMQTTALCLNSFRNKAELIRKIAADNELFKLIADGLDNDVFLLKEGCDALQRDVRGMLDGNNKCKEIRR